MKAIAIQKPYEIGLTDLPMPTPGEGEALLRVLYCGICGADVASFTGNQPFTTYPRIPGHEFSAQIVSIPDNDRGLKAGDVAWSTPARTTRPWACSGMARSASILPCPSAASFPARAFLPGSWR